MISLIAALSENFVIGRDNDLPWRLKDDFRHFKQTTTNHCLIMGRKTFESIGSKPLANRRNIVISRSGIRPTGGVEVVDSISRALEACNGDEIFIGGGEGIFRETLPLADRLILTRVHAIVSGDTYFPEIDFEEWNLISSERHEADENNEYPFSIEVWTRRPGDPTD